MWHRFYISTTQHNAQFWSDTEVQLSLLSLSLVLRRSSIVNHTRISTRGAVSFFQTILAWEWTSNDEATFQTTCKVKDLTEKFPDVSNFHSNWSSSPSTKVYWLMGCRRSWNNSCSQTNIFLLHKKFHSHKLFCHCPMSVMRQCWCDDIEWSLGNLSFRIPPSSHKSSQNLVWLPLPTFFHNPC